jgi:hypothetical protein
MASQASVPASFTVGGLTGCDQSVMSGEANA